MLSQITHPLPTSGLNFPRRIITTPTQSAPTRLFHYLLPTNLRPRSHVSFHWAFKLSSRTHPTRSSLLALAHLRVIFVSQSAFRTPTRIFNFAHFLQPSTLHFSTPFSFVCYFFAFRVPFLRSVRDCKLLVRLVVKKRFYCTYEVFSNKWLNTELMALGNSISIV